ncbi:MAG: hypothetical protein U0353_11510 [Sandaracinus sp.]
MRTTTRLVSGSVTALALTLGSCGGSGPTADAGGDAPCVAPAAPYGIRVGDRMEGFTLPRCDGSMMTLYDSHLCEYSLIVVTIATGWCGACAAQSEQLTREIAIPYRDRGVRVVEVVYEDAEGGSPDAAFCTEWTTAAGGGLSEVDVVYTSHVPGFGVGADGSSLPITVVADQRGVIRSILSGTDDGLTELKAAIDAAL